MVAFYRAVWDVRALCHRGVAVRGIDELRDLIVTSVQCPWLTRNCPTRTKRQRRADRVREPEPVPGVVIYRSDGVSRGQGVATERVAG